MWNVHADSETQDVVIIQATIIYYFDLNNGQDQRLNKEKIQQPEKLLFYIYGRWMVEKTTDNIGGLIPKLVVCKSAPIVS